MDAGRTYSILLWLMDEDEGEELTIDLDGPFLLKTLSNGCCGWIHEERGRDWIGNRRKGEGKREREKRRNKVFSSQK